MVPWMSISASASGLPTSIDSSRASSAVFASIKSASLCSRPSRSSGVNRLQEPPSNSRRAAATALSRSATVALAMLEIVWVVDGSMTGTVAPSEESTQAPSINSLV